MAISILNNIASLKAQNLLAVKQTNLNKILFQLSSGSRINSAADDAAGLVIADGLRANVTALTRSAQNANSGVGSLQVADGSLAQVSQLLNRAFTLATEASNGRAVFTNTPAAIFLSDGASNSSISMATQALSFASLGLVAGTVNQTVPATSAEGHVNFSGAGPAAGEMITVVATSYTFRAAPAGATGNLSITGNLHLPNFTAINFNQVVLARASVTWFQAETQSRVGQKQAPATPGPGGSAAAEPAGPEKADVDKSQLRWSA